MRSLDILLVSLAIAQTTTGAALHARRTCPGRKRAIVVPYSPSAPANLLSLDGVDDPAAVMSSRLNIPVVDEASPLQVIPGSAGDLLPDWIESSGQNRVPAAGVQPATAAFAQSSPTATDSPFAPVRPSPPPRPEISTFFVTITNAPVTRTVLDTATFTHTITLPALPAPPSPPSPTAPPKDAWNPPADFANLDCFGIIKYGFGKSNIKVVHGIPTSASASAAGPIPTGALDWTNEMSAIEAFYPEGSINPGNSPQGGADFYANPLPALKDAQNVTFGYSVFLPVDFEPVRGGKLPGLYGGKTGCSGGDAALDCFSTRLMWRAKNDGELYLYAPKDKQTDAVCNTPPKSICEADYGLSIGRGSFKFTPGQWTHVSQTVVLNTPGRQDGYFTLDVNGKRVVDLQGVYYRQTATDEGEDMEVQSASTSGGGLDTASANGRDAPGQDVGTPNPNVESPSESGEGGGLLGHILLPRTNSGSATAAPVRHTPGRFPVLLAPNPHVRHQRPRRRDIHPSPPPPPPHDVAPQPPSPIRPDVKADTFTVTKVLQPATITVHSRVTETRFATIAAQSTPSVVNFATKNKVPGFSGIFFSTFFGGHEQNFATPKDQKMWFKDFELVVNE